MALPPYTMGQINNLDFTPLENALGRAIQQRQFNQRNALDQARMGMEQERMGFERQRMEQEAKLAPLRLSAEMQRIQAMRDELEFNRQHRPMQLDIERERLAGMRDELGFKRSTYPMQRDTMQTELDLKRKALEAEKFGVLKDGETPYVRDPRAPGGIRFIEPPRGMSGDKDFLKEAAKTQAQRYDDIIKHGEKQNIVMGDLDRMRDLNTVIGNPTFANQFIQKHGAWLKSVGIQPERMKSMELFESIVSRMAPQMRIPGAGATSDRDLEGFKASLPALMQTEDGRRLIIEQNRMIAQHAMKARDIASGVLTGEIPRAEGERRLRALPDPFSLWKSARNQIGDLGQTKDVPRQPGSIPTITNPEDAKKLGKGQRFIYNGQEYEVQ